ncbi:MAG: hypothetical protein M1549_01525 [Candidatus Dependentiae bacterium]|nr:hypothetical protein [Candidatus Dependentiae bacterium]
MDESSDSDRLLRLQKPAKDELVRIPLALSLSKGLNVLAVASTLFCKILGTALFFIGKGKGSFNLYALPKIGTQVFPEGLEGELKSLDGGIANHAVL